METKFISLLDQDIKIITNDVVQDPTKYTFFDSFTNEQGHEAQNLAAKIIVYNNKPKENEPLAFTCEGGFSLRFMNYSWGEEVQALSDVGLNVQLSKDKINWYDADSEEGIQLRYIDDGETLFMKGNNPNGFLSNNSDNIYIEVTGEHVTCSGNVMSLISETATEIPCPYCFQYLFNGCASLVTAPELPATTLADNCYSNMFKYCTSLTTAPELPATTLADNCYSNMFEDCSSLVNAPELHATTLANGCYDGMFQNCTSLVNAPELPATTLVDNCYSNMFHGCTSLTTAPELPATTLADNCYSYMFEYCSSLVNAPELPATTLDEFCYSFMFDGCTSLTTAPELPATTLAYGCYNSMFNDCTSLTTAPELLATTLADRCYAGMFIGCTSLVNAPELSATILTSECYNSMFHNCTSLSSITCLAESGMGENTSTYQWVYGVNSTGVFIKSANATWPSGANGIPNGWTVQDAS